MNSHVRRHPGVNLNGLIRGFQAMVLVMVAGCGQRNAYVPPPPPDVIVDLPVQRPITVYSEFTGTTQASEVVEVRPRVQGYLNSIYFADGSNVIRGDLLFVIDRRPYQALTDQAAADLESKKAAASRAEALYKRTLSLVPTHVAAQEDVDKDKGDWEVAKANVGLAEANLMTAQLNLDFTKVTAPISGRISRRLADVGNLVTTDSTLLTTITRFDPIYTYFTVSESEYLKYLKRVRERPAGTLEASEPPNPRVVVAVVVGLPASPPGGQWLAVGTLLAAEPRYPLEMGLANETGYPHQGYVDFADNTVDPSTGTLQIRGSFRNPEPYFLAPGLFVRVRVPIGSRDQALLIPDRALGTDQAGQYLLVVNQEDVVEHRPVTVGDQVGSLRVIEEGLQAGERFVVDGLQRARPGAKVNPKPKKDEG